MLATEVPDGLLFGLAPVAVTLFASFLVWLVLKSGKSESRLDVKDAQDQVRDKTLQDHEERLRRAGY
jgi:hypothetical protein